MPIRGVFQAAILHYQQALEPLLSLSPFTFRSSASSIEHHVNQPPESRSIEKKVSLLLQVECNINHRAYVINSPFFMNRFPDLVAAAFAGHWLMHETENAGAGTGATETEAKEDAAGKFYNWLIENNYKP
jgi:hypothetical protein